MAAAEPSRGPRTRRRCREQERSESTLHGQAVNNVADVNGDASQPEMASCWKTPRPTPTTVESESSSYVEMVSRTRKMQYEMVARERQERGEPPRFASATDRTTPPEPVTLNHRAEPVIPPHQTDPVSPPHQTGPGEPPRQTDPVIPPRQTEPVCGDPPPCPPTNLQSTNPPQGPPRQHRKVNARPKPRGCDSTGRRRSARLNPIDVPILNTTADTNHPESNPASDVDFEGTASLTPRSVRSNRAESSRSVRTLRSGKTIPTVKPPWCDPSLYARWPPHRTPRRAAGQVPPPQGPVHPLIQHPRLRETSPPPLPLPQRSRRPVSPPGPWPEASPAAGQSLPGAVLKEASTAAPQSTPRKSPAGPEPDPQRRSDGSGAEQMNSDQSSPPQGVFHDDGNRRCRMRRPLRSIPEARLLSGLELDNSASGVAAGKRKRRTKGKKPEVRNGRGLAKPRAPSKPDDRPKLMVVGDAEFTSEPHDTKVVATIRLLTLANLPGPFRSYNTLPSGARFDTLKQFLQRYSWGEEEDVLRCIDVFENIAAEAYSRVLVDTRRVCLEKYGPSKEEWKGYCPRWCKNEEIWKGLCDIWSTPMWEQQSSRNRANKLKCGSVASHVGGSRSTFRHKQKMIAERGDSVALKDVFDRTHLRKAKDGSKEYVNTRSRHAMVTYMELSAAHGKEMEEEKLWELAVDGEDRKGRLFGFGNKSRTSKANRELEAVEASASGPTKSTATSAEDCGRRFTEEEVAKIVAEKVAAARSCFAGEIATQELRHKAELEKASSDTALNNARFELLFKATGVKPPNPADVLARSMSGGGGNTLGEGTYRPKSREHILISPYMLNTWCDLQQLVRFAAACGRRRSIPPKKFWRLAHGSTVSIYGRFYGAKYGTGFLAVETARQSPKTEEEAASKSVAGQRDADAVPVPWVPYQNGYYRPANRLVEVDSAELR
ncbi:Plant transposase (Ptta/En/Spm family) [Carex littledalei]|uniref:Plant transposase (Ptta/En/Spm family) n=1 Tax=Carex littledalei TaxID=544730 RepID=A0A833S1H3_9POAL|nr:Plant transposase (Ptta/En/Spm family) [Carex littledalei]